MMFEEIDKESVRKYFPSFYDKNGKFFEIIKDGVPIGFMGLWPYGDSSSCNCAVHMIHKYKLSKNIISEGFKVALKIGYNKMFLYTNNKVVINFLDYMSKFGIKYLCNILGDRHYVKYLKEPS